MAVVANVAGFSVANSALLVAGYVLLLAAFGRIAFIISRGDATDHPSEVIRTAAVARF